MFLKRYNEKLMNRKNEGLLRMPALLASREGKHLMIGSNRVLNFSSNDYLGLGVSQWLSKRAARHFERRGTSASSSRLVSGNYATIWKAEEEYARYFGYEAAVFYPSGYQANTGILSSLFQKGDCLLFDKHIHASSVRGMTESGATFRGYNHNTMGHLRRRLQGISPRGAAVLTESLFSMDGDLLDIPGFGRLKEEYGFFGIVDEAHAFGAMGSMGRGIARGVADIAVGTFGKALGFFGAFVLCPQVVKEYLFNFSSPLIYSTSLPESHAAVAMDILDMLAQSEDKRDYLSDLSRSMKSRLQAEGFAVRGDAHVITVLIGHEGRAAEISRQLLSRNIFLSPLRYPTVPRGKAILRIGMTALHDEQDIALLVEGLKESGAAEMIIHE